MAQQSPPVLIDISVTPTKYSRIRPPFGYWGGKTEHVDFILPLLPADDAVYVEPFGGSAAVMLARQPAPMEIYNDINGEVVLFYRVLREQPEELIAAINLTPTSREEFYIACYDTREISDVERARRFWIKAAQSRNGIVWKASLSAWSRMSSNRRACIRRGRAKNVARTEVFKNALWPVVDRFLKVQIDNSPALEVVEHYDSPDTLFYCDPPYLHETRTDKAGYTSCELSLADHDALAQALTQCKGRVAVSLYDSDVLQELYPPGIWRRYYDKPKALTAANGAKPTRRVAELLLTNYDADARQIDLF